MVDQPADKACIRADDKDPEVLSGISVKRHTGTTIVFQVAVFPVATTTGIYGEAVKTPNASHAYIYHQNSSHAYMYQGEILR